MWGTPSPHTAEAPAATLHQFARAAREDVGQSLGNDLCKKNANRDAHRFVAKWGLAWRVPLSYIDHEEDGFPSKVAYISPKSFLKFLLEKAPELLMGGCPDVVTGQSHLETFWGAYQKVHGSHTLFHQHVDGRCWSNTLALALHGDEGRGLKKSNTTIITMETVLGVNTWENMCRKRTAFECNECHLDGSIAKRFRVQSGCLKGQSGASLCQFQSTNLKQHSFLTKFVLAALPNKDSALLDKLSIAIVRDMKSLFEEGLTVTSANNQVERWFAACTGMKGDLKWYQKVAGLTRSFASQIAVNKAMCHECLGGSKEYPFEDYAEYPSWGPTRYMERPFTVLPTWCHIPFEATLGNGEPPHERFFRRDIFHNTKMGIFRDFIASSLLVLCKLKYFNERGGGNDRDTLLARAHDHFRYFCKTTGRSPALRSFSSSFFNAPTWNTYPWINCKGSDTAILVAWLHVLLWGFLSDPLREEHKTILSRMHAAVGNARDFQRTSYSHGLWLHKHCAIKFFDDMHKFAKNYNACAFLALHQVKYTGFGMKSKFHMVLHAKLEVLELVNRNDVEWVPNVQMFGCEGNEDMVGKLSRLSRRVNSRLASRRALELYLMKCKAVHRRFRKSQPKQGNKPS